MKGVLTKEQKCSIFGNIKEIYEIHKGLEMELNKLIQTYPLVNATGSVFLKIAPSLKIYSEFANCFKYSMDTLLFCEKNNKNFQSFVQKQSNISGKIITIFIYLFNLFFIFFIYLIIFLLIFFFFFENKGYPLSMLILLPINHINNFNLILEEISWHTPTEMIGYSEIVDIVSIMNATSQHIANSLANSKTRSEIQELLKKMSNPKEFPSDTNQMTFLEKLEVVIEENTPENKKTKNPGFIYLFSEKLFIFYTKKNFLSLREILPLDQLSIEFISVDDLNKQFSLSLSINKKVTFLALGFDFNKKYEWNILLQNSISSCQKDRVFGVPLSQLWDRKDTVDFIPSVIRNVIEEISSDENSKIYLSIFLIFYFIFIFIYFIFFYF